ncbi:sensor histidine kinase [Chitinophaga lutea]|uniref:Sensor histidine kinase n=1 Tax=Chitinophaga lutea TaxID=2488634 RepID=A0A3N4QKZ5_9BACT|nr:histidine kinase [Chitinophaga lutea]RPE12394.1 sensor histidine kinase [Chitinophaga lutea]
MATHLLKEKPYRYTFIIGFVVFVNLHRIILHHWLGQEGMVSLVDSLVHNGVLFTVIAVLTQMQAHYRPTKGKYAYVALITLMKSALWAALVMFVLKLIYNDGEHTAYIQWLSDTLPIRFAMGWALIAGTGFISFFMYEIDEQREALARKETAEKLAREAELYKLRQQLQPHFLFNSLNSINALVSLRPEEARQMIQKLSDFLRGTLKKEDQLWIPLREELQYLQLYLDIEKVRFRHRLTTTVTQPDDADGLQIPPMLLQPVVENAIKFGLYDTTEAINITIEAKRERNVLTVAVSNPFDPQMHQQVQQGTGFGLNSIRRRLFLLFGRHDLLETQTNQNIFTTIIKVPQLHDKSSVDR